MERAINILHYVMGIPPVRGGGSVKYAIDLAEKQADFNHNVFLLYPGEINARKRSCIKRRNVKNKISYFEIINPLPVPGAFGICNEKYFIKETDSRIYYEFLKENDIDIIHFHSIQGLHIELLEAADELQIKKIFTSHDYFGICPKTDLIFKDKICNDTEWNKCVECSEHPDTYATLVRRQSHWFRNIVKCSPLCTFLEFAIGKIAKSINVCSKEKKRTALNIEGGYKELKNYYMEIFKRIDLMHYNSTIAKKKFEEFLGIRAFFLEGVMHNDIFDKRKRRCCGDIIRFGYLGNGETYKGFQMLIEALDELYAEKNYDFLLNIYFQSDLNRKYIVQHKRYQYSDIDTVFENMDVLLVPSLWAETYGLVVVEAIMHGVPVIITENVGARDFVEKYQGIGLVVKPDKGELSNVLLQLLHNKEKIDKMNSSICDSNISLDFKGYTQRIINIYRSLCEQ